MRITFVIASLSTGGAERVTSTMANYWAAKDWQVTIVTLADTSPFYVLDSRITLVQLGVFRISHNALQAVRNNIQRLSVLRRAIVQSHPNAVLSEIDRTNVRTLFALWGTRLPVIVTEHVDPSMHSIGRAWSPLRSVLYGRAQAVVVLTAQSRHFFSRRLQRRTLVIPNAIPANPLPHTGAVASPHEVIAMGRCVPIKGFDLLLEAWRLAVAGRSDWQLRILGDGPDRPALEAQALMLGLAENVCFQGVVSDPRPFLSAADIFVMSSRSEGFPMALGEAMASGLPAISFDCPSGPREIIRDGVDGFLVALEDVKGLATRLALLMDNAPLRLEMGQRAPEVVERFGLERVMAKWEDLLHRCK